MLDPATRSAKVRIELPNPQGIMRAGMFVTATFKGRELVERVVIPATAIVHLHDKDWVFVPVGNNQFRRVALQLGPQTSDGSVQVISGLKPQDKVATNALQLSYRGRGAVGMIGFLVNFALRNRMLVLGAGRGLLDLGHPLVPQSSG